MEYFYGGGGNNRPVFIYRFKVKPVTTEMYKWAQAYPEKGPFSRFHIEWEMHKGYDVIQFELRDAYLAFQYAFAGEIIEDVTMKEYK